MIYREAWRSFLKEETWSFSTVYEKQKESLTTNYRAKQASQIRPHHDSVGKRVTHCFSEITVIQLMKGFLKISKQEHHRPDKSVVVWRVGLGDDQEHPCRPAAGSDGWRLQIPMLAAQMEEEDPFCPCTALQGAGGRALTAVSRSGWRSGWRSWYKNFSTICQQRDSWAFSSRESCRAARRGGA